MVGTGRCRERDFKADVVSKVEEITDDGSVGLFLSGLERGRLRSSNEVETRRKGGGFDIGVCEARTVDGFEGEIGLGGV